MEKPRKREVLEGGRLLGVLARVDPEVYEAIKAEAEESGVPPHEVLIKIAKNYFLFQRVEQANLSVQQLMLAWDILERMLRFSMWLHASLATTFFSEMTEAYGKLIDERVKQHLKTIEETAGKEKGSEVAKRLMDVLVPVLEGFLQEMMRSVLKVGGVKVPGLKVPVNLEVAGESGSS